MHIGLDFDNTIVSYDEVFHQVALEQGLIPPGLLVSKVAVRDHLRAQGLEQTWIEMQGHVYGPRMADAVIYSGFLEFLEWAGSRGHTASIVSHKTLRPFAGPPHDLHAFARAWIDAKLVHGGEHLIAPERVYFETTKQAKFARIGAIECDVFIDDLPEILLAAEMPARPRKILFDPDDHHGAAHPGLTSVARWRDMRAALDE